MAILRQAEYKDKKTNELQSALARDFDEIEERIRTITSTLEKTNSDISGFSFPEAPTDQNHIQALSLFDADMSNLTGFPPLRDISFSDYNFEAVDPISLVFDKQFDIGQKHTLEIDLREFYKNLSTQYNLIFATLEKMMKEINRIMDIIQENGIDVLEALHISLSDKLKFNDFFFIYLLPPLSNLKNTATLIYTQSRLRDYLKTLDKTNFPAGFEFEGSIQRFGNIGAQLKSGSLRLFDRAAGTVYIETLFAGVDEIESIDLSEFETGEEDG